MSEGVSSPAPAGVVVHTLVTARSGPPLDRVRNKLSPVLHEWLQRFIALSPYVVLATSDGQGNCDASPRGGAPGFVRMLDERTLFIPEKPGNRLHQTLCNLRENSGLGLLFLLPGMPETARVNGRAEPIANNDPRWSELALGDTGQDELSWGTLVHVQEAYYHCGRAGRFGGLWNIEEIKRIQSDPPLPKRPAAHRTQ
ncbi:MULTISPECIES: pyridoxamine 5'-phosphate oxidase family protein [unclassified Streptomyces]|uniref:pyridoxamine 5'-phosphate oxidase family protein n=1 Tax=unclassified Streptomyces TaxID=2593676 RepID=UPI002E1EC3EE|nr:pyridoxamine 5'-phosphate oxidase family protein [Streptomyces sp. NBC_01023]